MDAFPLNDLPGELRNRIWRMVLVDAKPIDVTEKEQPEEPAIMATCRQIRNECSGIYYAENVFSLHTDGHMFRIPFMSRMPLEWLRSIDVGRARQIARLELHPPLKYPEGLAKEQKDFEVRLQYLRDVLNMSCKAWDFSDEVDQLARPGVPAHKIVLADSGRITEGDLMWILYKRAAEGVLEEAVADGGDPQGGPTLPRRYTRLKRRFSTRNVLRRKWDQAP